MANPFEIFRSWYELELEQTGVRIPSACCLSSTGEDGYPNSRFVSLKGIINDAFVITGPLNSRKGSEIAKNPKVAIALWWPESEKQVRIQGIAKVISASDSDKYFTERNRDSKIISTIFEQGQEIENLEKLQQRFELGKAERRGAEIPKPAQWSGFSIHPIRIEFLEFMETRLHKRTLFTKQDDKWEIMYLQP